MDPSNGSLRILAVCSHNRTRSVIVAALLASMLDDRVVEVRSSGFGPTGLPATEAAIAAMARRGIDVSAHRSAATTEALVRRAHLILTAERTHVVTIATLEPTSFGRAMTVPEFVDRARRVGFLDHDPTIGIQAMTKGRTASAYLRSAVDEIADPTGAPLREFERATAEIERTCRDVADLLARALHRG